MKKKQWYTNAAFGLAIYLIISINSILVFAESQLVTDISSSSLNNQDIDNMGPFHYGLFSGSLNTDLILQGENIRIFGDIHTNAGLKLNAYRFELSGVCETVNGHTLNVGNLILLTPTPINPPLVTPNPEDTSESSEPPKIKQSEFIGNQPLIKLIGIEYPLKKDFFIKNKLFDINPFNYTKLLNNLGDYSYHDSTFSIYQTFVVQDGTAYYFDGNLKIMNGVKFIGKGVIIARGDINIYGSSFDTTAGSAFIYSTNNGIRFFTSNQETIKAVFYAPQGNFVMEGSKTEIIGKIIANQVSTIPMTTTLTSDFVGFDDIIQRVITKNTWNADVNSDNAINMSDVMILAAVYNTVNGDIRYVEAYDLNSDGAINMTDIMIIAAKFNTIVSS